MITVENWGADHIQVVSESDDGAKLAVCERNFPLASIMVSDDSDEVWQEIAIEDQDELEELINALENLRE